KYMWETKKCKTAQEIIANWAALESQTQMLRPPNLHDAAQNTPASPLQRADDIGGRFGDF
ncbi:hypothetical protein A2U01_0072373, partial [Trifolium medium]|nr:hypothetical protein [Trifolium medium]